MEDIELVIKISEEIYNRYMNYTENYVDFMFFGTEEKVVRAIRNGTPLPKGHGDLIDRKELLRQPMDLANYPSNYVRIAPTIIEADKVESGDRNDV